MWERSRNCIAWEVIPDSRVPPYVVRRHNKKVKRGDRGDLVVPAQRYYYRFLFCV